MTNEEILKSNISHILEKKEKECDVKLNYDGRKVSIYKNGTLIFYRSYNKDEFEIIIDEMKKVKQ